MAERLRCFVVDAFTRRRFSGNPAAVVPLERWPGDDVLAGIAAEMKHSETAFFAPEGDAFRLRWFTPKVEVELCGHATLATAHVILSVLELARDRVGFETKSGRLEVERDGDALAMDLPVRVPVTTPVDDRVVEALGRRPTAMLQARDVIAVYDDAAHVRALEPDLPAIAALKDVFAVCVTAPGDAADRIDFVSRFFAPAKGVPEDPVTGSAHCSLAPYWANRLGKTRLEARQLSARGGELACTMRGDRVVLTGEAVLVLEGTLLV
jgi:PhzF family phenazine biosynthesis protein